MPTSLETINQALENLKQSLAAQEQVMISHNQRVDKLNIDATAEVKRLSRIPNPSAAADLAMDRLWKEMAKSVLTCSHGMQAELPQLQGAVATLQQEAPKVKSYIDPNSTVSKDAAIQLRNTMRELSQETDSTISKFLYGTNSIAGLQKHSPDLRVAAGQLTANLEETTKELRQLKSACERIVSSIDEVV